VGKGEASTSAFENAIRLGARLAAARSSQPSRGEAAALTR
jgi:hypothetical protein